MMHPHSAPPAAPQTASPSQTPESAASQGEAAHQVVGAMAPSVEVQNTFHKYTPEPIEGMPTPVRWLSAFAVSRWGMEALSDLCIHGSHSIEDSSYKIINSVYISFHPNDLGKLEKGLEAPADFTTSNSFPLPSNFWKDKGPYFAVLTGYAIIMTWIVLILMKRKDVS